MRTEIVLQEIGDGVTEAFVVEWLVAIGDRVEAGRPIVEVMTDKANMEIETPVSGTLIEQRFDVEARVEVGQVLAVIEGE
jgi:pyruvate/2-oxoglutarate dehydrogenase complex dihydrolipoamide acyltransferase (E2) component